MYTTKIHEQHAVHVLNSLIHLEQLNHFTYLNLLITVPTRYNLRSKRVAPAIKTRLNIWAIALIGHNKRVRTT